MKDRNVSADIIRIIAAFFVVFSHSTDRFVLWTQLQGSVSWDIVYYFNTLSRVAVPIFIILSGYLILKKDKTSDIRGFYRKRLMRVLWPLIAWLIIYFLWAMYWDQTQLTPEYIFQTLWAGTVWHLYFLIIIIELYLLTPLFMKILNNPSKRVQTIWFWVLLGTGIFWSILANIPGTHLDVKNNFFTMFLPYLGYYYAGAYLRDYKMTRVKSILCLLGYFVLAGVTNMIAGGNMSHLIVYNSSPTLLPMSLLLFLALKDVHILLPKKIAGKLNPKVILYISGLTFGIYLLHFLVLAVVLKQLHFMPWELQAPLALNAFLPSLITFAITFIVIAIWMKIPYLKSLLG